jgi:hypothetical protein
MGDVQSSTPGAGTTQPDQRPPISISHEVDPNGDLTLLVPKSCESDSNTYFWVSSKHLTLASSYFNTMLKDCWTEGQALKDGTAEILVHDCKPQILLIVLNVIHGRQRQVPRRLLLNEMSAVAVTTDFFQCHEALEVMAGIWIETLKSTVPSSLGKDLKTWIMISSVFNRPHILKATTRIAMQWGTRPFDNDNLPIPKNIKGTFHNRPFETLSTVC